MANDYQASLLEQLVPSQLSKWLLISLFPTAMGASGFYLSYASQLTPDKTTEEVQLIAGLVFLGVLLVLSWVIILDLSLLFKDKKHSRIYHHVNK